ncbi:MAG TPA: glycerophosphodiester phosphodiesterase [Stackebrandtia sp.]|jgi:glycerophosphoryl diester phosphodiesterase|uniref:glycerophosphodiester phosphodiesterase n=1 Tax=Stackebrandtia sp. TaxID=2023065 RepID=UPI002D6D2763|nr:glycerophosphodiester phosphodiesterase [Stackebrandtia sp.]HZE38580.1 glycerophosphodiester phosphodiesterase [Stackebrandtia sp.]
MNRTLLASAGAVGIFAGALLMSPTAQAADHQAHRPHCDVLITGHRGAAGYRPEHTIESYTVGADLGADYIEPDLVPTKDGQLVARHENDISQTTNVADHPEFADRKTTKVIEGKSITGWFTEDFTLKELKTLRAKERLPELRPYNTQYDGKFTIPTFEEVIKAREDLSHDTGRTIGIYPEIKHPAYFNSIGINVEKLIADTLKRHSLADANDPVLVQSFDPDSLRKIDGMVDNKLVYLIQDTAPTKAQLRSIAGWAYAVSYEKNLIIPRESDGSLGKPSSVVRDAHAAGLKVHAWTFRNENTFLPTDLRNGDYPADWGNYQEEYRRFFATGLDGLFSDFPDAAVAAREACQKDAERAG